MAARPSCTEPVDDRLEAHRGLGEGTGDVDMLTCDERRSPPEDRRSQPDRLPVRRPNWSVCMDVNVVILNWNAAQDTVASLRRLARWTQVESRIWVVDNGSHPDESAAIALACPAANLLRSERNLGFSGGTNLALRRLVEESVAPVLLLNSDVRIDESAVAALIDTLHRQPQCGIVGPVIVTAAEPQQVQSAGSRSPLLHRDHTIRTPPTDRPIYGVESVSGAAVLIRMTVLQRVGLLDEAYFFGLELADLCRRARDEGFLCLVNSTVRAEHDLERSSSLRETLYVYYAVRNRLLYARRSHPVAWPGPVTIWALYGLQQGIRLWIKRRRGTAIAILLGVRDGLRGRFGDQNAAVLSACASRPSNGGAAE